MEVGYDNKHFAECPNNLRWKALAPQVQAQLEQQWAQWKRGQQAGSGTAQQ